MKKSQKLVLFLCSSVLLGAVPSVHADLLELRLGAGITAADFDDLDKEVGQTNSSVSSDDIQNFNLDLMLNIPVSPINVGVRYEVANQDQSGGTIGNSDLVEWDLEVNKIMGLVDWRILDNVVYIGPIAGLGYAGSDFDLNVNGTKTDSSLNGVNYLLGLQGGVHISRFIVGAEVGYEGLSLDSPSGLSSDVDLSGVYGKLMVGLSFL